MREGVSTGACLQGAFHILHRLRAEGAGEHVMVAGEAGTPYADTYLHDDEWVGGMRGNCGTARRRN